MFRAGLFEGYMSNFIVAEILLQIACAYHSYKSGNWQPWLYIILIFPLMGSVIYLLAVVLPGLQHSNEARQLATGVRKLIDPDKDLRERLQQAELVDSADAKRGLADELMRRGDYPGAVKLLEGAATGIHADDPALLLVLAKARYGAFDFAGAQKTLDDLRAANPNWQSGDAHLLYARPLEGQGEDAAALSEYEAVAKYFAGEEAKCRLALFLQKVGRPDEARRVYETVVKSGERASKFQRQMQKEWYALAKRNVAS
jgi:hypothetical protein